MSLNYLKWAVNVYKLTKSDEYKIKKFKFVKYCILMFRVCKILGAGDDDDDDQIAHEAFFR